MSQFPMLEREAQSADHGPKGEIMKRITPNRRVVLGSCIAVVATVALAFAAGALGTGTADTQEIVKLKRQVAALQADARRAHPQVSVLNVMSRIAYLDAVGFHGLENAAHNGTMTSRDAVRIKNALKIAAKIPWPKPLEGDAAALVKDMRAFRTAWDAGDMKGVIEAMESIHGTAHALSAAAYLWLE